MIQQIKIRDNTNNREFGGIMLDNGSVICGCCGSLIEPDDLSLDIFDYSTEFTLLKKFNNWINISDIILGNF